MTANSVTTSGDEADGIFIETYGDISVAVNEVLTSGDFAAGIFLTSNNDITVEAGNVATTGNVASAISADSDGGDVSISVDTASVDGDSAAAIEARSVGGDVVIVANEVTASGDRYVEDDPGGPGGPIGPGGPGGPPGPPMGTAGNPAGLAPGFNVIGIAVETFDSDLSITVGELTASGENVNGINAFATNGIATVEAGTVEVSGRGGVNGVRVRGDLGASLKVDEVFASTAGAGARGNAISVGSVLNEARVEANRVVSEGSNMVGVDLISLAGSIYGSVGEIATSGNSSIGYNALSSGMIENGATVTLLANLVSTAGDYSSGVVARNLATTNTIRIGSIETAGAYSVGVFASTSVGSDIEVGTVTTSGDAADGIQAFGMAVVNLGVQPIVRAPEELFPDFGDLTTGSEGSGNTGAFSSLELQLLANAGPGLLPGGKLPATVTITADSIETSGDSARGIAARSTGDVTIAVNSVSTTGGTTTVTEAYRIDEYGNPERGRFDVDDRASIGVEARSDFGAVDVTAGAISTLGANAHGISTLTRAGATSLTVGSIAVSGAGADGITATSETGDVNVTITGEVLSQQGAGVRIASAGDVTVTVASGGLLDSSADGFALVVEPGMVTPLPTPGVEIEPVPVPVTFGATVQTEGGGTLAGRISLTDGDDTFQNGGTFRASGTSLFGDGDDVLINTGSVFANEGAANFSGLETFDNQGLFSLANGASGDSFDFTGITFVGGEGSTLGFDIVNDGGTILADSIVFGDVTGSTNVAVTWTGAVALDTRVDLITLTDPDIAAAFALSGETSDFGFLSGRLVREAGTVALAMAPDEEVFEIVRTGRMASDHWQRGIDAFRYQAATARNLPQEDGISVWGQYFDDSREATATDLTVAFGGETITQAIENEDHATGFETGISLRRGGFAFGAMAGHTRSENRFAGTQNTYRMESENVGLFAGWQGETLFANLVGKVDFGSIDFELASVGDATSTDVTVYGASGEIGARFGGDTFFVEPVAALNWASADFNTVDFGTDAFELDHGESLRGEIGARAGASLALGGVAVRPHAGIFWVNEFGSQNSAMFLSGATSLAIEDNAVDGYGKAEFGLSALVADMLDLSVGGEVYVGDLGGSALRVQAILRF